MNNSDDRPLVTIGMPVHNGEQFLHDALSSATGQTVRNIEIIVSDNASTDRTQEISEDFAARDSRVKYVRHPRNIGAAKNYNHTFYCAEGEFFCWLAHDDVLKPKFLETCINGFAKHGETAVLVYPNFRYVDASLVETEVDSKFVHAMDRSPLKRFAATLDGLGLVTSVFGLYRRDALAKTRLIGSFISSDYALLVECALLGQVVRLEGDPQFLRRLHESNSRRANKKAADVLNWFDPDATVDKKPKRRLSQEYLRSIFHIDDLAYSEKLKIAAYLQLRRMVARARNTLAKKANT
ncbi:MAG: glycosyltransferase family 2 protein [Pseudomonadota bacterium]